MSSYWQPGLTLEDIEKEVIEKAVKFYRGNQTSAAQALGISVKTLYNKLAKYEKEEELKNERKAQKLPKGATIPSPQGFDLEPPTRVEAQRPVSLPERKEVQEVSPGVATRSRNRKAGA